MAKSSLVVSRSKPFDITELEEHSVCKSLPTQAQVLHGCLHCEWLSTKHCDFPVKAKNIKSRNRLFMCKKRYAYLCLLYDGKRANPSYREWHCSYLRKQNIQVYSPLYSDFWKINQDITEKEQYLLDNGPEISLESDIQHMKKERVVLVKQLTELGLGLEKIHQMALNRESREKEGDKNRETLGLSDIHRIMRSEVDVVEVPDEKE